MDSVAYVCQHDLRGFIESKLGTEDWLTVYATLDGRNSNGSFFCGLIPNSRVPDSLRYESWDVSIGDGLPGCSQTYVAGEPVTVYERFTTRSEAEPFVVRRSFHGLRPSYSEIVEEFRFFHNLCFDSQTNVFLRIDESGEEVPVIRIDDRGIHVRRLELRQFLAVKEMHLAIFFDSVRHSPANLDQVPDEDRSRKHRSGLLCYHLHVGDDHGRSPGSNTFSRLLGKKLIAPLPKEKSGVWPYSESEPEEYEEFIIRLDEDGEPVMHRCDPDKLSNYFGGNPGAPHYLTPVFFRREVLRKYFDNPQRYTVGDNYLRCGGLWGMRMDNNRGDYVIAYLGDLGRDLPKAERPYWRSFNVPPEGGVSRATFTRDFMAQLTEPDQPDLLFKYRFSIFSRTWEEQFGWPLFRPLTEADEHEFVTLRIPLSNNQAEFDDQILALAKILVDSLHEVKLMEGLSEASPDLRGIDKLELFLRENAFLETERVVTFLRGVQSIRSTGVAHRKGSNYEKAAAWFDIGKRPLPETFAAILTEAIVVLDLLGRFFLQNEEA